MRARQRGFQEDTNVFDTDTAEVSGLLTGKPLASDSPSDQGQIRHLGDPVPGDAQTV